MTKAQIVEELANENRVELMIANIAHQRLSPELKDLAQEIYIILLEYDEDKIFDLYEHDQMNFFIARIIINQFRSSNSPFHKVFRKYAQYFEEVVHWNEDTDECLDFQAINSIRVLYDE